ncbi:MAG: hypothetical protein GEV09_11110 [Pseudonocardiaceae bacterium]|nr:hypothetical protein [Pseudonocardiaceae bacterium]
MTFKVQSDPVDRPAVTELLLKVTMRGVIDYDTTREWFGDTGIGDRTISELVAEEVLAQDGEFLYVTEAGDRRLTKHLRAQVGPEDEEALAEFADTFIGLDAELKVTLTDWQHSQREGDPESQIAAVERWLDIDRRLHEAAGRMGAAKHLFGRYLDRLQASRHATLAGETDQLSGVNESSYHSLWFLLHEILLRSLGRERQE